MTTKQMNQLGLLKNQAANIQSTLFVLETMTRGPFETSFLYTELEDINIQIKDLEEAIKGDTRG